MRWLAVLLIPLLAVMYAVGPVCALGVEGEASTSNGSETSATAPAGNEDNEYSINH